MSQRPLKIGITCYPTVGGSGILATALGEELARRGHDVHFISYERPFRLSPDSPRVQFHPVGVSDYDLFKYPDYTLPLSVRMAEVSRDYSLDLLHVHYAVPHATAAILARAMVTGSRPPRVITTLHGTDTTLLCRDADYGPAIRHALQCSDAVTTVSEYLRGETHRLLEFDKPIEVVHNFFIPRPPSRTRAAIRSELGVSDDEILLLHSSNLRPVKRIDLLLQVLSLLMPRQRFKLLVLAGSSFEPFHSLVEQLGLQSQIIVREKVQDVENYLPAADISLVTSDSESFCISILEAMFFSCPSVSTQVGGIPEVIEHQVSGWLAAAGEATGLAAGVQRLADEPVLRAKLGAAAQERALQLFTAEKIVSQYEALYRRTCVE